MILLIQYTIFSFIITSCKLPTKYGIFNLDIHRVNNIDISVLSKNIKTRYITNYLKNGGSNNKESTDLSNGINVLVRVHDACMTSEIFSSLRCDCDEQLKLSMKLINQHNGIIIYTPNEGRGIGLTNKVRAYNVQDEYNLDTYEANEYINQPEDIREYYYVNQIVNEYRIFSINLLTNSKIKLSRLENQGLNIINITPLFIAPNKFNKKYLITKRKMNIFDKEANNNLLKNYDNKVAYCTIEEAIQELRNNKPLIVVDDEDRENEGDLIYPAETITPEIMAFFLKYSSGLICCAMSYEMVERLNLKQMVIENTDIHSTAFTVSVDYKIGTTTGISAEDRALTCNKLCTAVDLSYFTTPGHMFPLRAHPNGLKSRQGHTEASVKLCELAGFKSAAVISEITSEDKIRMANKKELEKLAIENSLKIVSIKNLMNFNPEQ